MGVYNIKINGLLMIELIVGMGAKIILYLFAVFLLKLLIVVRRVVGPLLHLLAQLLNVLCRTI